MSPSRSSAGRKRVNVPSRWIPDPDLPRVRWSKVLTAQARIAVDYYDRPDVKDAVLEAVVKELSKR